MAALEKRKEGSEIIVEVKESIDSNDQFYDEIKPFRRPSGPRPRWAGRGSQTLRRSAGPMILESASLYKGS